MVSVPYRLWWVCLWVSIFVAIRWSACDVVAVGLDSVCAVW